MLPIKGSVSRDFRNHGVRIEKFAGLWLPKKGQTDKNPFNDELNSRVKSGGSILALWCHQHRRVRFQLETETEF